MKKKILYILTMALTSQNLLLASEVKEARNAVISNHASLAQSELSRKCQKIQKKIRKLEDRLSDESIEEKRLDLMKKINKYYQLLDSLNALKGSVETLHPNNPE